MTEQSLDYPFDICRLCGRWVLDRGVRFTVEGGWDRDGDALAARYLYDLLLSQRDRDRERFADFHARIARYIGFKGLEIPEQLNELGHGIWEFKAGNDRITFYETLCGRRRVVRLLHHFKKAQQKTPLGEIDRARAIRREDEAR